MYRLKNQNFIVFNLFFEKMVSIFLAFFAHFRSVGFEQTGISVISGFWIAVLSIEYRGEFKSGAMRRL